MWQFRLFSGRNDFGPCAWLPGDIVARLRIRADAPPARGLDFGPQREVSQLSLLTTPKCLRTRAFETR